MMSFPTPGKPLGRRMQDGGESCLLGCLELWFELLDGILRYGPNFRRLIEVMFSDVCFSVLISIFISFRIDIALAKAYGSISVPVDFEIIFY